MSAVVAFIVLKNQKTKRLEAPKRKKINRPPSPPDLVPDTLENKALYEGYKCKFTAAYGCAPPSISVARALWGKLRRSVQEPETSLKCLQPLTYDKWREVQKRRKVFLANQTRTRRSQLAEECDAGAAAGPIRGVPLPTSLQPHFLAVGDASLYDYQDDASSVADSVATMSMADFETAEVHGNGEELTSAPQPRRFPSSFISTQGRPNIVAASDASHAQSFRASFLR